ncbi:MAG: YihY/virulence factor BrkB family protein [Gammaproteobacteria bacterium]
MGIRLRVRWRVAIRALGRPIHRVISVLQRIWHWGRALAREYVNSQINLRAMSLVYTTFLSLVPLIAITLSVLKGFGWHNVVLPFLLRFLAPMGSRGIIVAQHILSFIHRVHASVLGSLGLVLLLYTAVSLMQKVESACNHIWRIRKPRTLLSRFSDYLSVLLVGPILVLAALGMTAGIMDSHWTHELLAIQPFGALYLTGLRVAPYLLIVSAFTFLYVFMPNTRVRLRSALLGAILAGLLWEGVGWGFAQFASTMTGYTAIYSGFALLLLFMIWLYLSWLIFLIGVEISFLAQNPAALRLHDLRYPLTHRELERNGLLFMYLVAQAYQNRERLWTLQKLCGRLFLPPDVVQWFLDCFQDSGLLLTTGGDPPSLVPARALSDIPVAEVLAAVRGRNPDPEFRRSEEAGPERAVDERLADIDRAIVEELASVSLGSWVSELPRRPVEGAVPAREGMTHASGSRPRKTGVKAALVQAPE